MPEFLCLPLALGPFISGGMLLWGLVAAVPIVLHLLNRRRRQTISWPAMQFLREAIQQRSRNIQFWQWLMLLARVLAVLLIAAALANPVLRQMPRQPRAPAQTHILVVDASYSMRAVGGGEETRFQDAVDRAIQECQAAPPGDRFVVVAMQAEPIAVVSRPSADRTAVQQELLQLECSFTAASLTATMSLLERLLPVSDESEVRLVFFTDAQKLTWQAAVEASGQAAWRSLQQRVRTLQVVDVTNEDPATAANATLTTLEVSAADRLAVAARSYEAEKAATSQLTVTVADQPVYSTRLQFAKTGSVWTDVAVLPADQESVVRAELQEDGLETDNTRWLIRRPHKAFRVVCLGPPQSTRFIAAALSAVGPSKWDVKTATVPQWTDQPQPSVDLLMLCDPSNLAPAVLDTVQHVNAGGGGVVWWLGPDAVPAEYARAEIPFRLKHVAEADLYPIDPRGYQHPIAAPFAPYPQSGLLSTPIFRYWRLDDLGLETDGEVALGVGGDSAPFVMTIQRPRGRWAVVTSIPMAAQSGSGEPPWNALVAWPSLVPLVQEIAAWATAPLQASPELHVGDRLSSEQVQAEGLPTQVVAPDGQVLAVRAETREDGASWTAGVVSQPGVYEVRWEDQTRQRWAVNVDPAEGDLRTLDVQSLQKLDSGSARDLRVSRTQVASPMSGWEGFRWLLAAAMIWLVAESLISRFALRWQL